MTWIKINPGDPKREELLNLDHVVRFRLTDFGRFDVFLLCGTSFEMRSFDDFELVTELGMAMLKLKLQASKGRDAK